MVASSFMVVWLVVEPVLKIRLAAEATPLEPNWRSPATCNSELGVVVPIPTFLAEVTLKIEVASDEATLNGSKVVVP